MRNSRDCGSKYQHYGKEVPISFTESVRAQGRKHFRYHEMTSRHPRMTFVPETSTVIKIAVMTDTSL